MVNGSENSERLSKRRGYLNPTLVRSIAFWLTSACIMIAVLASLLAIWRFTGTDVLWRTVATCFVVAFGTISFTFVNSLFACPPD